MTTAVRVPLVLVLLPRRRESQKLVSDVVMTVAAVVNKDTNGLYFMYVLTSCECMYAYFRECKQQAGSCDLG